MRTFCTAVLSFLVLGLCSAAAAPNERNTQVISDAVYLKPQRLVEVDRGRRLNIYCSGMGSPTVVFDSGLGGTLMDWAKVQPAVAARSRACSYDRAGLGFSDPGSREGTSANIVDDLHHLLRAAGIKPPYVLVGHSMGGMDIKLYAEKHQKEVAGMVFVDPSHEDLSKRSWALQPESVKIYDQVKRYNDSLIECVQAESSAFSPGSTLQLRCATAPNQDRFSEEINTLQRAHALRPGNIKGWISEQLNVWAASADQLRAARRSLGAMPLIVLTHEPLPKGANETQELRNALNQVRTELHADIAGMSTRGSVRMVRNSGHYFQLDQPQEVVAAIIDVINAQ